MADKLEVGQLQEKLRIAQEKKHNLMQALERTRAQIADNHSNSITASAKEGRALLQEVPREQIEELRSLLREIRGLNSALDKIYSEHQMISLQGKESADGSALQAEKDINAVATLKEATGSDGPLSESMPSAGAQVRGLNAAEAARSFQELMGLSDATTQKLEVFLADSLERMRLRHLNKSAEKASAAMDKDIT